MWQELVQDRWLEMPVLRSAPVTVVLLDDGVLGQAPGRGARRRAAHWALHGTPLVPPAAAPPALRLAALVLAAHSCGSAGHGTDMDVLVRLCGHSPHQMVDLMDRLVAVRTLAAWSHNRETDEVSWCLPVRRTHSRSPGHGTRYRPPAG
ncbi:hypothetical protein L1856_05770 [Streptomyces sp. Tue 6430]|nr:hypothetical protein [Streptomyces sp. Tue 6430]